MCPSSALLGLLTGLTILGTGQCRTVSVLYSSINFTCNAPSRFKNMQPYVAVWRYWLLPTGEMLGNERLPGVSTAVSLKVQQLEKGRVLHVADVTDERYFGTYYCFTFIPQLCSLTLEKHDLQPAHIAMPDFFRMNANKIMLALAVGSLLLFLLVVAHITRSAYKDTMTQKPKPKVMTEGTAPAAPAVSAIPAAVAIPSVKRAVGDKVLTPVIANTQCPQQIPEGKVAVTVVVGGGDTAA